MATKVCSYDFFLVCFLYADFFFFCMVWFTTRLPIMNEFRTCDLGVYLFFWLWFVTYFSSFFGRFWFVLMGIVT